MLRPNSKAPNQPSSTTSSTHEPFSRVVGPRIVAAAVVLLLTILTPLAASAASSSARAAGSSGDVTVALGLLKQTSATKRTAAEPKASISRQTAATKRRVPPPPPASLAVAGSTQSSITIRWAASTDRWSGYYEVYENGKQVGRTSSTYYTVAGLKCGTSHTLGVTKLAYLFGRSAPIEIVAATSPCADTQAPTAPAGVAQVGRTTTSATISWNPSTDNVGIVRYDAYRDGVAVGYAAGTTYTFTGLVCKATYFVAVEASDAAGNHSGRSEFIVSTSPCSDTTPPSAPGALAPSAVTKTSVALGWGPSSDDTGVAGYDVWRNGAAAGTAQQNAYTVAGLVCGTGYTFEVGAFDAAGNRSARRSAVIATSACATAPPLDVTAPSVPQGMTLAAATTATLTQTWNASTDDVGVSGYNLWLDGAKVAQTTGTTYTYSGLTCGTTYTLALEAFDKAGNTSDRAYATNDSAETAPCASPTAPSPPPPAPSDTQPPSTPANFAVTAVTTTSITLGWSLSTDNVGVTGYRVRRGSTVAGSTAGTTYTVSGLACGSTAALSVEAYDAAGNASLAASVNAATAACPDGQPPTQPASVTQSSRTETSISVGWPVVDRQRRRDRLLAVPERSEGQHRAGHELHVHGPLVCEHVHACGRRVRRRRQRVVEGDRADVDGRLRGHAAPVRAPGHDPDGQDRDDADADVECSDRQRRCGRLQPLAERGEGRHDDEHELHVRWVVVRHDVRPRARGVRRRRQHVRSGVRHQRRRSDNGVRGACASASAARLASARLASARLASARLASAFASSADVRHDVAARRGRERGVEDSPARRGDPARRRRVGLRSR